MSEIIGINIDDLYFDENAFKITRKGGAQSILYYSDGVKDVIKEYYNERVKIPKEKTDSPCPFLITPKQANFSESIGEFSQKVQ